MNREEYTMIKAQMDDLFHRLDPERVAASLTRAESDFPEVRAAYRKGVKSTLQLFTEDYDLIERIMTEFDDIYNGI